MTHVLAYLAKQLPGMGIGFVVGAFTPAVGRKIKAFEVSIARKIVAKADGAVKAVEKKL